mgnify:CR=1 FL=1
MNDPNVSLPLCSHALDHALLRAGVRAACRHERGPHGGAQESGASSCSSSLTRACMADLRRDVRHLDRGDVRARRHSRSSAARLSSFMQVIWAIGASMVLLAALQFLGRTACLAARGCRSSLGHNALDGHLARSAGILDAQPDRCGRRCTRQMSKRRRPVPLRCSSIRSLPWLGVMLLGFGASVLFEREPARAQSRAARAGASHYGRCSSCCAPSTVYGEPNPLAVAGSAARATAHRFPEHHASIRRACCSCSMTLGPAAIVCALRRSTGPASSRDTFVMFGRVPFAFYVAALLPAALT